MKSKFPIVVEQGSVSVKIYRMPSNGCDSYTLSHYQDGIRRRPTFSTLQAAKDEANVVVNRLGNSDVDVLTLTSADRAAYLRARQLLDPFGLGIETAAAQVAEAPVRSRPLPCLFVTTAKYLARFMSQKRESLEMQEKDWARLYDLAAKTKSTWSGKPSWRRLVLRIARGEITLRVKDDFGLQHGETIRERRSEREDFQKWGAS